MATNFLSRSLLGFSSRLLSTLSCNLGTDVLAYSDAAVCFSYYCVSRAVLHVSTEKAASPQRRQSHLCRHKTQHSAEDRLSAHPPSLLGPAPCCK